MKLRSANSASAGASSTPTALHSVSTGVTKAKRKSTVAASKHSSVKKSAKSVKRTVKSVKAPDNADSTGALWKKVSGNHTAKVKRAGKPGTAKNATSKAASKPVSTGDENKNKRKAEKRECVVCTDSKYLGRNDSNFPKFSSCDHDPQTCKECIVKHSLIKLKARCIAPTPGRGLNFWSAITCPQCNGTLTEEELRSALSRVEIKPLVKMVTLNSLHSDKRWVWCVSQTCPSGQIHKKSTKKDSEAARMVQCVQCGVKACIMHRDVWHQGMTCAQYDDQNPKSESVKSSEERIRNMTKKCPTAGCGWRIQKDGGCSSMYCPQCGQYFSWGRVRYDKGAIPEPEPW